MLELENGVQCVQVIIRKAEECILTGAGALSNSSLKFRLSQIFSSLDTRLVERHAEGARGGTKFSTRARYTARIKEIKLE